MGIKIQPYVEMLIDALENKGASRSGLAYDQAVLLYPSLYRDLLERIRAKELDLNQIQAEMQVLKQKVMIAAGNNQRYRIEQILEALEIFFEKELITPTNLD